MVDTLAELAGMSVFTAGLTVGSMWMALRGRLNVMAAKQEDLGDRMTRVEGRLDKHFNGKC